MLLLTCVSQAFLASYYCTLRQAVLKSAKKVENSRQLSRKTSGITREKSNLKSEKKETAKTGAKSIVRLTRFFVFANFIMLMVNGYCALYGLSRVLGDRSVPLPSNDPNIYNPISCTCCACFYNSNSRNFPRLNPLSKHLTISSLSSALTFGLLLGCCAVGLARPDNPNNPQ